MDNHDIIDRIIEENNNIKVCACCGAMILGLGDNICEWCSERGENEYSDS